MRASVARIRASAIRNWPRCSGNGNADTEWPQWRSDRHDGAFKDGEYAAAADGPAGSDLTPGDAVSRLACMKRAHPVRLAVVAALLFLPVFGIACRSTTIAEGVTDSTFAAVLGDLRRIPSARGPDSTRSRASRDSVLRRYGIPAATLERVAARLSDDPVRAQRIWEAIQRRAEAGRAVP